MNIENISGRKSCNVGNVKHYLAEAIKLLEMMPAEVLAIAKANGRAALVDAQIAEALKSKGWVTDGDAYGSIMRYGDGSYGIPADLVASLDLVAWMIGK